MQTFYALSADAIALVHLAYVAFVVLGLVAILVGMLLGWRWIRNPWFRGLHLAAILFVAAEALAGVTCPLTIWEQDLRIAAGQETFEGQFVANCVQAIMFFEAPAWVFTLCYCLFATAVLATFVLVPPRFKRG